MDPLEQLVDLLAPRASVWKRLTGQGSWAWRMPADAGVVLGRVTGQSCRFDVPGHVAFTVENGDCVLLASPPAWTLSSTTGSASPVDLADVRLPTDDMPGEEGRGTRLTGGHFDLDPVNAVLLSGFLRPITHIRAARGEPPLLEQLLGLLDHEGAGTRPGRDAILARLMEAVLIEVLRSPSIDLDQQAGLVRGLADADIARVLQSFHADIAAPWSIASLAAKAQMSRSTFVRRFTDLVGQPPMTYTSAWRMATARRALAHGTRTIDELARETGYASSSAFRAAFARAVGQPPGAYARATSARTRPRPVAASR